MSLQGKFTYEAINSMKYLDMCFKESLRLYGAVPRYERISQINIMKVITVLFHNPSESASYRVNVARKF